MKAKFLQLAITLLMMFALNSARAQDRLTYKFLTVSQDAINGLKGSEPTQNRPELNVIIKAGARVEQVEIGVLYETFPAIGFHKYGVEVGGIFEPIYNVEIVPSLELGSIIRDESKGWVGGNYLTYAINNEVRYQITDQYYIGVKTNIQRRTDLSGGLLDVDGKYILSNYLTFGFKF